VVDQDRGEHNEREELEELRLPILEGGLTESDDVSRERGCLTVGTDILDVGTPLGDRLADPTEKEEREERDRESEVGPDTGDPG
jgi:hypothetical protein